MLRWALVTIATVALAFVIWVGYGQDWTGFGTKTLWDWLDLAVVPVSLALVAVFLNRAASKRDRRLAAEREFFALLAPTLPREASLATLRIYIFSTLACWMHVAGPRYFGPCTTRGS